MDWFDTVNNIMKKIQSFSTLIDNTDLTNYYFNNINVKIHYDYIGLGKSVYERQTLDRLFLSRTLF